MCVQAAREDPVADATTGTRRLRTCARTLPKPVPQQQHGAHVGVVGGVDELAPRGQHRAKRAQDELAHLVGATGVRHRHGFLAGAALQTARLATPKQLAREHDGKLGQLARGGLEDGHGLGVARLGGPCGKAAQRGGLGAVVGQVVAHVADDVELLGEAQPLHHHVVQRPARRAPVALAREGGEQLLADPPAAPLVTNLMAPAAAALDPSVADAKRDRARPGLEHDTVAQRQRRRERRLAVVHERVGPLACHARDALPDTVGDAVLLAKPGDTEAHAELDHVVAPDQLVDALREEALHAVVANLLEVRGSQPQGVDAGQVVVEQRKRRLGPAAVNSDVVHGCLLRVCANRWRARTENPPPG